MQFIHVLPFPLTLLREDIAFGGPCGRCVLMKLVGFAVFVASFKKMGECFAPPSPPIGGVPQVWFRLKALRAAACQGELQDASRTQPKLEK